MKNNFIPLMPETNTIKLTRREHEIMARVICGKQNKEIARELFCEVCTVKKHLRNIYSKLKVKNRTAASIKFMEITGRMIKEST
jgi:DNA-binding NarL/FixJ family response regulator